MEKSSVYLEIFSGDGLDEIAPIIHPPATALDDPVWPFLPSDGKADAACHQFTDADFIARVSGYDPDGAMKLVRRERPAPVMDFVKSAIRTNSASPLRKQRIQAIVDAVRNHAVFAPVKQSQRWNSLAQSIENFVATAVATA